LQLKNYILFVDEVLRLETPGLLLKIIADLKLPIKMLASGLSQLELKSKMKEHLTGRQIEALILPLSCEEISFQENIQDVLLYGTYPKVYLAEQKAVFLQELFNDYFNSRGCQMYTMLKRMSFFLALYCYTFYFIFIVLSFWTIKKITIR
jgi:predicted AAA+ superfamily ATPase